jgi:hypothetical protein
MLRISNEEWFEANLDPQEYRAKLGVNIPNLPPDEFQVRFTGRNGRENLQHAFDFYNFVLANLPDLNIDKYDVLDFGGGWGRILRFFIREFRAEQLIMADCLTEAIECARTLDSPFKIIHSDVNPPLPLTQGSIGLCYAFSVFSHLAEQQCCDWLAYFGKLLLSGGKLFVTTRGHSQIDYLENLGKTESPNPMLSLLPSPKIIRAEYEKGVFQFYSVGGGGELTPDFYGETWIPRQWLEERHSSFGFSGCEFYTEFQTVDQCVFVLTK